MAIVVTAMEATHVDITQKAKTFRKTQHTSVEETFTIKCSGIGLWVAIVALRYLRPTHPHHTHIAARMHACEVRPRFACNMCYAPFKINKNMHMCVMSVLLSFRKDEHPILQNEKKKKQTCRLVPPLPTRPSSLPLSTSLISSSCWQPNRSSKHASSLDFLFTNHFANTPLHVQNRHANIQTFKDSLPS